MMCNSILFQTGNFEEAEESMRSQYKILEEEVARYKVRRPLSTLQS